MRDLNKKEDFKNPHLIYIEKEKEENKEKNNSIKAPIIINNNIININNYNFVNLGDKNIKSIKNLDNEETDHSQSFIKKNNLLIPLNGIIQGNMLKQEEQFSYIRKLSNFKSTQALLKGYNKRSSSALNIRGGRKYTNYPLMKNKI